MSAKSTTTKKTKNVAKTIVNHFVKIKPEATHFVSSHGIGSNIREAELIVSRVNPNGTIVVAYSKSLIEIDALFLKDVEILDSVRTYHDEVTECPDVSIRIFGVPERIDCIRENQKRLGIPDELVFIDKNHDGCIPTAKKAWSYPTDKKFVLVLQDDVELCDNFLQYVNTIVKTQPDAIISLFSLQFTKRISLNKLPKISPYVAVKSASGQGIIMKTEYVEPCVGAWKEEIKGDDMNIAAWANENGIQILTTFPTIVQHMGQKSVFDPSRSLGKSEFYDKNPIDVNWDNPYVTNYTNIIRY